MSAIIKVVDGSNGDRPVIGAKVLVRRPSSPAPTTNDWDHAPRTGINGLVPTSATSVATPGATWAVTIRKPGFGPAGLTTVGDATVTLDLTKQDNVQLTVKLTNVWGLVTSTNLTAGGQPFETWYNTVFRPRFADKKQLPEHIQKALVTYGVAFPAIGNVAAYKAIFDKPAELFDTPLTVEEFIGMFLIVANETGGSFKPGIPERGNPPNPLKYFFEKKLNKDPKTGEIKVTGHSYNESPNHHAGDQLDQMKRDGKLKENVDIFAWNDVWMYPDPPPGSALETAAKECDFNKFRGHGLVQLTWRPAYRAFCFPTLKAKNHVTAANADDALDSLTTKQLEDIIESDHDVHMAMAKGVFVGHSKELRGANSEEWLPVGLAIGGGPIYGDLYKWRGENLYAALQADGFKAG